MKKVRIDQYIYEAFNIGTLDDIQRLIMAGKVLNNNQPVYKPSEMIYPSVSNVRFRNMKTYASRGGLKLEHAIRYFDLDFNDKVIMDIGSSTGGFTDCSLKHGASLVYAVDVGTNQLDYQLRTDDRVIVMEQTNVKRTTISDFKRLPHFVTIDVSFTSINPILSHLAHMFTHEYSVISLIKPQFETYLEEVETGGVIHDLSSHEKVVKRVIHNARSLGISPMDITPSPIKGSKGNIEYLLYGRTVYPAENHIPLSSIKNIIYKK